MRLRTVRRSPAEQACRRRQESGPEVQPCRASEGTTRGALEADRECRLADAVRANERDDQASRPQDTPRDPEGLVESASPHEHRSRANSLSAFVQHTKRRGEVGSLAGECVCECRAGVPEVMFQSISSGGTIKPKDAPQLLSVSGPQMSLVRPLEREVEGLRRSGGDPTALRSLRCLQGQ
jgi:hypothetical protein